jgi:hypothetical protein
MTYQCLFAGSGSTCGMKGNLTQIRITLGQVAYAGALCRLHVQAAEKLISNLGVEPTSTRVNGHKRQVYLSNSGVPFRAADVREWLGEGSGRGRLAQSRIDAYAEVH